MTTGVSTGGPERLEPLAVRYRLPPHATAALNCFLRSLVEDPRAPTAVREPVRVAEDHLADALVALELPEVTQALRVVDIGAGAGLPGIPLSITRPDASFVLLESAVRKCTYLSQVIERCRVANACVVHARAEAWPEGLCSFDLAVARAVAPVPVLLEYAAPLLTLGGTLVAWRGRREPEAEAAAALAADELGLQPTRIQRVFPYAAAEHRHLHLWSKVRDTPDRFPRRPGMALKRPLGARSPSDRARR